MPWNRITSLTQCELVTPLGNFSELFLLKNFDETSWLIGQYKEMIRFATALRSNNALRDFLSVHRIRIGLRSTDIPPVNPRQESYGVTIRGKGLDKDFTAKRLCRIALPVRGSKSLPPNRITDCKENVEIFWASQTPQSHHIVEFNNLKALSVSRKEGKRDMDYHQLPTVLLAAEFHQRYISAILKPTHVWKKRKLQSEICDVYHRLYLGRSPLFEPLWMVSKAILEKAGLKAA